MHSPARGCVVARAAGKLGLIWRVAGAELGILPIMVPRAHFADDVALDYRDLVAWTVALPLRAIVRPTPFLVAASGQTVVGRLSAAALGRVETAISRRAQTATVVTRWTGEREHRRDNATCVPINMVAP